MHFSLIVYFMLYLNELSYVLFFFPTGAKFYLDCPNIARGGGGE